MRSIMLAGLLALSAPAAAEIVTAGPNGFEVRETASIVAPVPQAYAAFSRIGSWWSGEHSYSGEAANLRLDLRAGGCFCERWDGNGVEHGRVVMLMPGKLLRLDAALGPLQELAISGVINVALEEKEGTTTMVVTHRVSGDATHKLDGLAPIVDQVNGLQFGNLAAEAAKP